VGGSYDKRIPITRVHFTFSDLTEDEARHTTSSAPESATRTPFAGWPWTASVRNPATLVTPIAPSSGA